MKIDTYIKRNTNTVPRTYPYLGVTEDGMAVMFTSVGCGFVLKSATSLTPVGHHSNSWIESAFEVLDGEITLKNIVK